MLKLLEGIWRRKLAISKVQFHSNKFSFLSENSRCMYLDSRKQIRQIQNLSAPKRHF